MLEVEPEKYLSCPICQGIVEDPVTLQCNHTYCRKCITDYIKYRGDARIDKIIPCALKCEGTAVPDPQKPPEDWANQLRPSFIISNLVDDYLRTADLPQTSEEHSEPFPQCKQHQDELVKLICGDCNKAICNTCCNLYHRQCKSVMDARMGDKCKFKGCECSRCNRNNKKTPAVKWCQMCGQSLCDACISSHRRDPTTRQHTVTDLPQTKENQPQALPQCEHHPDDTLKLICEDCNKAICTTCCSLHHRQCKSVVLMEAKGIQIIERVTGGKYKLEGKIEEVSTAIATNRSKYDLMVSDKTSQKKLIKDKFKNIMEYIQEIEKRLLQELDDVIEEEINLIQDTIQLEGNRLQLYQQRVKFIDQAVKSGSLFDMFRMSQSLLTGDVSQTDNIKQSVSVSKHVKYKVNSDELMDQIKKLDFGFIQIEHESDSKPRVAKFKLSGIIGCRLLDDGNNPNLLSITVLEVGGIHTVIVADSENKCLKSFFTRDNKTCHSHLYLDNEPKGIAQLKDKVMAAVPDSRQIVTVEVTPDLRLLSTIHTSEEFSSLAVMGDTTLVAGCIRCVAILNIEGEMMKSITSHNDIDLFKYPDHMCVSKTGHLLVSDWGRKQVTCLTEEGEVVWTYTGTGDTRLRDPKGITTTSRGDILVADRFLGEVIQLSKSGEYVGNVLTSQDGLKYPVGTCADKHDSLFVCDVGTVKRYQTVSV